MMVLVGRGETTKVRVRNRRIAKGVEQTARTAITTKYNAHGDPCKAGRTRDQRGKAHERGRSKHVIMQLNKHE
jgi:hypothetical protein